MSSSAQPPLLIVEDDPAMTELYALYLSADPDLCYQPTIVDNGAAAIEHCRTNRPDCAIFDFQLPDTTGLELLGMLGSASSRAGDDARALDVLARADRIASAGPAPPHRALRKGGGMHHAHGIAVHNPARHPIRFP